MQQDRFTDPLEIQRLRAACGQTQRQFAERLGISMRTLQNWEAGRYVPTTAARRLLGTVRAPKSRPTPE